MSAKNSQQPVYDTGAVRSQGFDSSPVTRYSSLLLAVFICQISIVNIAFGAEAASHEAEWKEWLWRAVNFAILVFILVKFVGKPLKGFLEKRTNLIEKTLREAKEARELAEKALAEIEKRISLKDREIEEILEHSRRSAMSEHDLLVKQGEQMKEKILEHARANIRHEVRQAKDAIKAEAVEIAMEIAEKKLRERLTGEKQLELIEESLAKVERK